MPCRNFDQRRNPFLLRHAQCFQTIARPAVKEIVATTVKMARRDPIEVFFLCPIIIRAFEKREQPHRMPAKRLNEARRDFALAIVVGDRFAEKTSSIRRTQRSSLRTMIGRLTSGVSVRSRE